MASIVLGAWAQDLFYRSGKFMKVVLKPKTADECFSLQGARLNTALSTLSIRFQVLFLPFCRWGTEDQERQTAQAGLLVPRHRRFQKALTSSRGKQSHTCMHACTHTHILTHVQLCTETPSPNSREGVPGTNFSDPHLAGGEQRGPEGS